MRASSLSLGCLLALLAARSERALVDHRPFQGVQEKAAAEIPIYLAVPESLERGSQLDAVRTPAGRLGPSGRRYIEPFWPQLIRRPPAERDRPERDRQVPEAIDRGMLFDGLQRRHLR